MSERILVVDTEETLRSRCQNELRHEGYQVVTAENGQEALRKLQKEQIDLVVLELDLPDGPGVDCLQELVRTKRDVKVVINTGSPSYQLDFNCWAADAFLLKSRDLGALKQTVNRLLHAGRN
ncbi:MAG: response regulator [Calditrichaeota bacterium]|nr:MAG: response regulator [Calditrichota bacterium]